MIDRHYQNESAQLDSEHYEDNDSEFEFEWATDEPANFELDEIEQETPDLDDPESLRSLKLAAALDADDMIGIFFAQEDFALPLLDLEQEQELGTTIQVGRDAIYYMIAKLAEELDPEEIGTDIYIVAVESLAKSPGERSISDDKIIDKAYKHLIKNHLDLLPENLLSIYETGIIARNTMVSHNVKLAVSWVKKYGISLDTIQEANIGLIIAANKYDPKRGYRFSTYATWWIKQKIVRQIQGDKQMKVPVHANELWQKIKKLRKIMEQELNTLDITDYQLAERMIQEGLVKPTNPKNIVEHIQALRQGMGSLPSLNETFADEDDGGEIGDYVGDGKALIPGSAPHLDTMFIEQYLHVLSERQQQIIILRYIEGFTLEEVATMIPSLNDENRNFITRERVRQIEKEALRKLYQYMYPEKYNTEHGYESRHSKRNGRNNGYTGSIFES